MRSLLEIEAAAEALPPAEKAALMRFLAGCLYPTEADSRGAKLVPGPDGTLLLEAPPEAPPMTTERVKHLLEDFP